MNFPERKFNSIARRIFDVPKLWCRWIFYTLTGNIFNFLYNVFHVRVPISLTKSKRNTKYI
jgi:hypothetical protein